MYIKLGKTTVVYSKETVDDFMIYGEVVDSQLSYEKPVLVRTSQELDSWFGQDFSERDYFLELLGNGITLYLTKPLGDSDNGDSVDLNDYAEEVYNDTYKVFYNRNIEDIGDNKYLDFTSNGFVIYPWSSSGESGVLYNIIEDNDPELTWTYTTESGDTVEIGYTKYIWLDEEYVKTSSIVSTSISTNNRDTLYLGGIYKYYKCSEDDSGEDYNYWEEVESSEIQDDSLTVYSSLPDLSDFSVGEYIKVREDSYFCCPSYTEKGLDSETVISKFPGSDCLSSIEPGLTTFAWSIKFPDTLNFFVAVKDTGQTQYYVYYAGTDGSSGADSVIAVLQGKGIACSDKVEVSSIEELEGYLVVLGYIVENDIVYSPTPFPTTYFSFDYSVGDDYTEGDQYILTPSYEESQNLVWNTYKDSCIIKFWSKTIGTAGPDGKISIEIEDIGDEGYRFTIERYGVTEVFEGFTNPEVGTERIDYIIGRESNLVYCSIIDKTKDLPVGTWNMNGAVEEEYDGVMYNTALTELADTNKAVIIPIDFILVPDIDKYSFTPSDFLEIAEEINCQVLFQNTESNYSWNLTDEPENRLIYFYGGMYYNQEYRPGYYLYLSGLSSGIFSATSNKILYPSLIDYDPSNDVIEELEEAKSNYLIDSGQYWYYRTFFDGDSYTTSGWMRFSIGKISREIDKGTRDLIGEKINTSKLTKRLKNIFDKLLESFSIIYSITFSDTEDVSVDYENNSVTVSLETQINDLVKSDITLDFTINYIKSY